MPVSVWILGDQLLEQHPAIAAAEAQVGRSQLRLVLIESKTRIKRLPYHRKKLVLLFSAMRHYAAWLQERDYHVDYLRAENMLSGLRMHVARQRPDTLFCMAASEYGGRQFQTQLSEKLGIPVKVLPNTQFLCGRFHLDQIFSADRRMVMETFYRALRLRSGLLLDDDVQRGVIPTSGRWNFDAENRRPLPRSLNIPDYQRFKPDFLTQTVIEEVRQFEGAIGSVDGFDLAVTAQDAWQAFQDFLDHRLEYFGAYQDAMRADSDTLFHARISPYLNLGLLDPLAVAREVEQRFRQGQAPLAAVEGFIRQVIGWREFMYWNYWRQMPALRKVNHWQAQRSLPGYFWNGETDINCLRQIIRRALKSGYAHHIERLMVVSNFCQLAGIHPQQVTDWFTSCFIDAYEWVMLPNVLGMGLYADGGMIATKPYVASANYIQRMSDYCAGCQYQPKTRIGQKACPFNFLYWNFLIQRQAELNRNPRMATNLFGLRNLDLQEQQAIQRKAEEYFVNNEKR
jgi:deoxyribodipyrimidine photolyase-related protein